MQILEALKSRIAEYGIDATIEYLLSEDLSPQEKAEYEKVHVFNRGYLCLSLIYYLA